MDTVTFKDFMDLYDNWNGAIRVNDNELNPIIEGNINVIMDAKEELFNKEIVAFGFYSGVLTVRIKTGNEDKATDFGYSEQNWNDVLSALGYVEQKNPNGIDCYDIYEDGIPKWQYSGLEEKKMFYYFFLGQNVMKIHKELGDK